MLKVAFPIGELFHEHHHHHSAEELCTHATGKQCEHEAHFSGLCEHHFDCIFHQLHTFFTQPYFVYEIVVGEVKIHFQNEYQPANRVVLYTPSRAPPYKQSSSHIFATV
ncbi:hypothetical protein [Capnocytophaga sp.]|uniref:hypothetical protein n=1 Tax=Capnocytophaga sp. TaxID=44737 RepID=UPI0026DC7401|nr:hypothetical protein [Capnocytophaga sp.]MDO5104589.1 hypothetical protein [Capnocytophaga sp.]